MQKMMKKMKKKTVSGRDWGPFREKSVKNYLAPAFFAAYGAA